MNSYIVWGAKQTAGFVSPWIAKHPAEASLIAAGLANAKTRGFVADVLGVVIKETMRGNWNIARGIGQSLVNRSTTANYTVNAMKSLGSGVKRLMLRQPVATVGLMYMTTAATTLALSQDEDPLTESVQVKAASHGWAGLSWPGIGSWAPPGGWTNP